MDLRANPLGLSRQPIFDQDLNVVAYELLYRSEKRDQIEKLLSGDQETCNVLIDHFTNIYDSGTLRSLPAFLNITDGFLRTGSLPSLSRHNLVINLSQASTSQAFIHALKKYVEAGYRLVLNDFEYHPEYDALLELAAIVRVDIRHYSDQEVLQHLAQLKKFNVTCLAEQVESYVEFERCQSLGFKLFQGNFLSKPAIIEGRKLNSNQAVIIHLLAALQDKDVTPAELADISSRDPQLTYKLLRIVNSAQYNLSNKIESLSQAIIALGINEVNKWATLLALSSNDERPSELVRQILMTARMCEFVAYKTKEVDSELAFMTGVLSLLDALLEIDQQTLLSQLSISEDIISAITRYEGKAGKLLQAINFYMIGQSSFNLPPSLQEIYAEAYYESLRWSNETMQIMQGSHL